MKSKLTAVILTILLVGTIMTMVPAILAESTEEYESGTELLYTEVTQQIIIGAGERYYIAFDQTTGQLEYMSQPKLESNCYQAIGAVPEWLRLNLTLKFQELDATTRGELADLIIGITDPLIVDEVAFSIAHMPAATLKSQYFFPQLLIDNADMIYEVDPFLQYVRIVEYPDHTTVAYINETGSEIEVPKDIYYWYIVHPKITDEVPTYVNPDYDYTMQNPYIRDYGVAPPTGKYWREWLLYNNDSSEDVHPIPYGGSNRAFYTGLENGTHIAAGTITTELRNIFLLNNEDISATATLTNQVADNYTVTDGPKTWHILNKTDKYEVRRFFFMKACPMLYDKLVDCTDIREAVINMSSWLSNSLKFTSNNERPIQPVRIYRKHIGRCGEHQDMRAAIARIGLVAVYGVNSIGSDHVWNEVWDQGWWHWDGGNYGTTGGKAGRDSMMAVRPDTKQWSVSDHYTPYCDLKVNVMDAYGRPVDGAHVIIASQRLADGSSLGYSGWNSTDVNGRSTFKLGDAWHFYVRIESHGLGNIPATANQFTKVIDNAADGGVYYYNVSTNLGLGELDATVLSSSEKTDHAIEAEINVVSSITSGDDQFSSNKHEWFQHGGDIDVFITDQKGYLDYNTSAGTNVYWISNRTSDESLRFDIPKESKWYMVLSNEFSKRSTKVVNITYKVFNTPWIEFDSPANGTEYSVGEDVIFMGSSASGWGVDEVQLRVGNGSWVACEDYSTGTPWEEWYYTLDTDGIAPGLWEIQARLNDSEHYVHTSIWIKLNDTTPPEVEITAPSKNTEFRKDTNFTVEGTVSDDVEVGKVELTVGAGGYVEVEFNATTGEWSFEVDPSLHPVGALSLNARAFDGSGNSDTDSTTVTLLEVDGPVVTILTPAEGTVVAKGEKVTVTGTVVDNSTIVSFSSIISSKTTDLLTALASDGSFSFDVDTGAYGEGDLTIELLALDLPGNNGSGSVGIIIDDTAPEVTIEAPIDGTLIGATGDLPLNGTATDANGISSIVVLIDGSEVTGIVQVGDAYSLNIDHSSLAEGYHEIDVIATDIAGWESEESTTFTIDRTPPTIQLDASAGRIIIGETVTVSGSVADTNGVDTVTMTTGNGTPTEVSVVSGSFSIDIDTTGMSAGDLVVTIEATDVVGNSAESSIMVQLIDETTDTDSDGMPDVWEIDKGLDPEVNDANADPDGDEKTNLDEYLEGTNPAVYDEVQVTSESTSVPMFAIVAVIILVLVLLALGTVAVFFLMKRQQAPLPEETTDEEPEPESEKEEPEEEETPEEEEEPEEEDTPEEEEAPEEEEPESSEEPSEEETPDDKDTDEKEEE